MSAQSFENPKKMVLLNGEPLRVQPLESLTKKIANPLSLSHTIAFVSSEKMLVTEVYLPHLKNIGSQPEKALLYALEEELSDDIETLSLSILEENKTLGRFKVAVFHQSCMNQWFECLERQDCLPSRVMPDFFLLPYEGENEWQGFIDSSGRAIIRIDFYRGFSVEKENLAHYIDSALQSKLVANVERIKIYVVNQQDENIDGIAELKEKIDIQIISLGEAATIEDVALIGSLQFPEVNLLEHHPQNRSYTSAKKLKKWVSPALLFLIWMGLLLLLGGGEYLYLKIQNASVEKAMRAIYFKLYPQSTEMVSPQSRMEKELAYYQDAKTSFWSGLLKIGEALEKEPKADLKNIHYENGRFKLSVESQNIIAIESLNQYFKNEGLAISDMNIVSVNQLISETLTLKAR